MSENRFRVNHGVVNVGELAQCVGVGKLQLDPQRKFVKRIDANLGRVINPTVTMERKRDILNPFRFACRLPEDYRPTEQRVVRPVC